MWLPHLKVFVLLSIAAWSLSELQAVPQAHKVTGFEQEDSCLAKATGAPCQERACPALVQKCSPEGAMRTCCMKREPAATIYLLQALVFNSSLLSSKTKVVMLWGGISSCALFRGVLLLVAVICEFWGQTAKMRKGVIFCPHVRREHALSQDVLIKCTDFMQKSNVVVYSKKKKL